ncbi:MAG: fucose isomerase [Lacunisphaera sp.]|nr:fucose isomerase [Lacunisphaera sp.]MDB6165139.1 fucose isomerase [Lacunisphaera sp.]
MRRWKETAERGPIMHAVIHGVTRDLMMARHQANHIQVAYAKSAAADLAAYPKGSLAAQLGLEVSFCDTKADGAGFGSGPGLAGLIEDRASIIECE